METITYHKTNKLNSAINVIGGYRTIGGANSEYRVFVPKTNLKLLENKEYVPAYDITELTFQNGNPAEEINGLTNEVLLAILIDRLTGFIAGFGAKDQHTRETNEKALASLQEALITLTKRTRKREEQGIEGTQEILK
jgi:hypothetical protein